MLWVPCAIRSVRVRAPFVLVNKHVIRPLFSYVIADVSVTYVVVMWCATYATKLDAPDAHAAATPYTHTHTLLTAGHGATKSQPLAPI